MNVSRLVEHIKWAEGTGPYHEDTDTYHLYVDSVGKQTIGYGHNIDDRGLDASVVELQLRNDIRDVVQICSGFDFWSSLNDTRQLVVADMVFNMGQSRFNKFQKFKAALRMGDYILASTEMENSLWYKQVGRRARMLSSAMRTGIWTD